MGDLGNRAATANSAASAARPPSSPGRWSEQTLPGEKQGKIQTTAGESNILKKLVRRRSDAEFESDPFINQPEDTATPAPLSQAVSTPSRGGSLRDVLGMGDESSRALPPDDPEANSTPSSRSSTADDNANREPRHSLLPRTAANLPTREAGLEESTEQEGGRERGLIRNGKIVRRAIPAEPAAERPYQNEEDSDSRREPNSRLKMAERRTARAAEGGQRPHEADAMPTNLDPRQVPRLSHDLDERLQVEFLPAPRETPRMKKVTLESTRSNSDANSEIEDVASPPYRENRRPLMARSFGEATRELPLPTPPRSVPESRRSRSSASGRGSASSRQAPARRASQESTDRNLEITPRVATGPIIRPARGNERPQPRDVSPVPPSAVPAQPGDGGPAAPVSAQTLPQTGPAVDPSAVPRSAVTRVRLPVQFDGIIEVEAQEESAVPTDVPLQIPQQFEDSIPSNVPPPPGPLPEAIPAPVPDRNWPARKSSLPPGVVQKKSPSPQTAGTTTIANLTEEEGGDAAFDHSAIGRSALIGLAIGGAGILGLILWQILERRQFKRRRARMGKMTPPSLALQNAAEGNAAGTSTIPMTAATEGHSGQSPSSGEHRQAA